MKIAVSAMENSLDSQIDPRFGRCQYFLIIDSDTMDFEEVSNKGAAASGGAGVYAAQTIANKGVSVLITGDVGPIAYQILSPVGIKVFTGASGTVKEAFEQYKSGSLRQASGATAKIHAGIKGRGQGGG
ncbi:MAG: NifB/NifX family molybdenum-iron cluster-binding protein [Candidatus Methanoperedenaceae archaeon]|nr:NifB/NifX family molybdenum-iron cluster-binding protein [Candidatus Methanoperedenaceae archaeon]